MNILHTSKALQRYNDSNLKNAQTNCLVYARAKQESGKRFNLPYRLSRQRLKQFGLSESEINAFIFNEYQEQSMFYAKKSN
jgi:hypothetical protein